VSGEGSIISGLNLGSSKKVLEGATDSPLTKLLTNLTQDVIDQLSKNIDKYNISASNELKQSIKPTSVKLEGDLVSDGISANFYWKYLNYGVNGTEMQYGAPSWGKETGGTKSFKDSITDWIGNRGITLPAQFSSYDSFAFAIMTNKKKHGEKPRPFFTDVVNSKLVDTLKEPIEKLLKRSIEITIVEPWQ